MRVAAVSSGYVLMGRAATLDKTLDLLRQAAEGGAQLVAFPEVFIPGTPIWIDSGPIWEGDAQWYALLVDQAVVIPGPETDAIGRAAREARAYVIIGVDERERHGTARHDDLPARGDDPVGRPRPGRRVRRPPLRRSRRALPPAGRVPADRGHPSPTRGDRPGRPVGRLTVGLPGGRERPGRPCRSARSA